MLESQVGQRAAWEALSVRRREVDGAMVVQVAGELDAHTGSQVRQAIDESLDEVTVHTVVIDLSAVTFFGSTGVAALVTASNEAAKVQKMLRIVVGDSRAVRRTLAATGMDTVLGVPSP